MSALTTHDPALSVCTTSRPVALRVLGAAGRWWAARNARAACQRSLADIPESLRRDIGLEGNVPLARFENGGRTFISHGRPDSLLSGWHW